MENRVSTDDIPPITALDIRVGHIVDIKKHPDADSLYVEQVDVGEDGPRTIVSGLVNYVNIESLLYSTVIVLCNLKPRNMRGIKSNGMLLCASDEGHEKVEPLRPPAGAVIGERVYFGTEKEQPDPEVPNKLQKKKIWESLQPTLRTGEDGTANFSGSDMNTSSGKVKAPTLVHGRIS